MHPKVVLDAKFQGMSQYGDVVGWDLDFRQLDIGQLDARIKVMSMNFGVFLRVGFNRSFHQLGCPPENQLTFGIPDWDLGGFDWCSAASEGGSLLNFNLESGFEGVSPAGFSGYTFTFNTKALQSFADQLGVRENLHSLVRGSSSWQSSAILSLSQRLQWLSNELKTEQVSALQENAELLNEGVAISLFETLLSDSTLHKMATASNRQIVLKRSLAILDDFENLPITVGQLCRKANTSLSTLKRAFIEEFGIPPKAYIRVRCLSAVRDELARSTDGTRIADVANRWGFWHMGQFAADYQGLIGELPSDTLKRHQ